AGRRRATTRRVRLVGRVWRAALGSMARLPLRRTSERACGLRMKQLSAEDASLLELVGRLLNKGVVLAGEATISVAGVDLIYLGLNVVLAAVESIEKSQERRAS